MIEIKYFPIERVELYSPDGEKLGNITQEELLHFRCKIIDNLIPGYYILTDTGFKTTFNKYGEPDHWEDGTFKGVFRQALKLRFKTREVLGLNEEP